MKPVDLLQTMALSYQEICQGARPWVALGNFMNDWFDYAKDRRTELVADPITVPFSPTGEQWKWAVFCAASVEYLCDRYHVPCPSWVYQSAYALSEPWFDSPGASKPEVRERLLQKTPEPFIRRNIYCGNHMFDNKYEFAEKYRQFAASRKAAASHTNS